MSEIGKSRARWRRWLALAVLLLLFVLLYPQLRDFGAEIYRSFA